MFPKKGLFGIALTKVLGPEGLIALTLALGPLCASSGLPVIETCPLEIEFAFTGLGEAEFCF